MGDSDITGTDKTTLGANYDYVTDTEKGAAPCKAAKYYDYFTGCLPGAQKGPSVPIGMSGILPVIGTSTNMGQPAKAIDTNLVDKQLFLTTPSNQTYATVGARQEPGSSTYNMLTANKTITMGVDMSQAVGATVNQLRQAFAIQKFYERQALGGTRYIEMVKSHFDVTNPDFRMQRPEYLGGERIPLNINQVIQSNDSSTSTTPLGTTGAYSVTANVNEDLFTHSFTEHGILLGLAVVRTLHTYQQGLNRMYSKKKMTDFYFPEFANLGNQAVLNKEIYIEDPTGTNYNEEAFGYQEAWACERYFPDIVTGEMRSNYAQSLDVWHYADDYNSLPSLGDVWIDETDENVKRTLAVQSHDQMLGDFYFGAIYTRPMPLWSIPGLIDHH